MKLYRHKKGMVYVFLYLATHTETREQLAVYKALYGDGKVWCRPLSMFMEGDRFTCIQIDELNKNELEYLVEIYQVKDGLP